MGMGEEWNSGEFSKSQLFYLVLQKGYANEAP